MAGDWIHFDKSLPHKPELLRIAAAAGVSRGDALLALILLWSWADSHSEDGRLPVTDVTLLSQVCHGVPVTFWRHVVDAGWLVVGEGYVEIPNFDRWMGRSAKKRLNACRRQQRSRRNRPPVTRKSRAKCDNGVTGAQPGRDESVTRVEKSRVDIKNPPYPPQLDTPEFRAAWSDWAAHRKGIGHPLTPEAARRQLKALAEMGPARALAALDHSIRQGYRGVFEPAAPRGLPPAPPPAESDAEAAARLRREREREAAERAAARGGLFPEGETHG